MGRARNRLSVVPVSRLVDLNQMLTLSDEQFYAQQSIEKILSDLYGERYPENQLYAVAEYINMSFYRKVEVTHLVGLLSRLPGPDKLNEIHWEAKKINTEIAKTDCFLLKKRGNGATATPDFDDYYKNDICRRFASAVSALTYCGDAAVFSLESYREFCETRNKEDAFEHLVSKARIDFRRLQVSARKSFQEALLLNAENSI